MILTENIRITLDESQLERILATLNPQANIHALLTEINERTKNIMAGIDDANAALAKIDAATTQQGTVLAAEAATLQTVSDEVDALIKQAAAGGVPPALVAALQAQADKVAAISVGIQKNADFSTAVASKGVANPVPLPVPVPVA